MTQIVFGPNRAYPSIPSVSGDVDNHTLVLQAMREALEIHERRTKNVLDSFVRLGELQDLGLLNLDTDTGIVEDDDDDGSFIKRDGTSSATTGLILFGAGISVAGLADLATLSASGAVDFNDVLDVEGAVTFQSTLQVDGTSIFTDSISLKADINTATPPTTETPVAEYAIVDLAEDDTLAFWGFSGVDNSLIFRNWMRGGPITLITTDAAGTAFNVLSSDPDTDTRFYHKGNERLITQDAGNLWIASDVSTATPPTSEAVFAGFSMVDAGLDDFLMQLAFSGNNFLQLKNQMHGGHIWITAENASGTEQLMLDLDPDIGVVSARNFYLSGSVRISDSVGTDYGTQSHDGTDYNWDFTNTTYLRSTGADWLINTPGLFSVRDASGVQHFSVNHSGGIVDVREGLILRVRDAGNTDYADFSHDGTDFNSAFTNSADWNITGLSRINVFNGASFEIWDSTNTDRIDMSHDGTDAVFLFGGTTDVRFGGASGEYIFEEGGSAVIRVGGDGTGDTNEIIIGKGFDVESGISFDRGSSTDVRLYVDASENFFISLDHDNALGADSVLNVAHNGSTFLTIGNDGTDTNLTFAGTAEANFIGATNYVFDGEVVFAAGGSQSNPQLTFAGDSDTGLYRNAADTLSITVGGTRQAVFASSGITFDNDWVQADSEGSRFVAGPQSTGTSGVFGGTQHTDAAALSYRTYWAYDSYWDETNNQWVANRTTLGRKFMIDMGYHNNAIRFRSFDGTVSSPWADSDWTDMLEIFSTAMFANVPMYVRDGSALRIYDSTNADFGEFSHDGADFNTTFTNTNYWDISGSGMLAIRLEGGLDLHLKDAGILRIYDSTDTDYLQILHDGTDVKVTGSSTTDIDFTGFTYYNFQTGGRLRVWDSTNTDYFYALHDGSNVIFDTINTSSYAFRMGGSNIFQLDSSNDRIVNYAPIFIEEQASANADVAGFGQLWVRNDSPNTLMFTDDAGNDHDLTAGGGSQTPWTSDIDGAGFGLDNIDRLEIQDAGATDSITFTHNGTDALLDSTNTESLNINDMYVQARYGFHGGYSEAASNNWAGNIWGIDTTWMGGESGSSFAVSGSQYGLVWVRESHAANVAVAGEGLQVYRGGALSATIGRIATAFETPVYMAGDKVGHFETLTGNYGSVQVDGDEGSAGWAGYNIQGEFIFMWSDSGNQGGIFFDTPNEWALLAHENSSIDMYYNGQVNLRTSDESAVDAASGAEVRGCDDNFYYVGYNTLPLDNTMQSGNVTLGQSNIGKMFFYNSATARSVLINNLTAIPLGSTWALIVGPSAGTCTLDGGTGVTLTYWNGSSWTTTAAAGNITAGEGQFTIWKETDTNFYVSGPNLS